MQTYAIGDVHGRIDLLDAALSWIGDDRAVRGAEQATVVFLGDYVDRGPGSAASVARVMAGPSRPGERWVALKGNHEQMMLSALADADGRPAGARGFTYWESWTANGGLATLASYGARSGATPGEAAASVPRDHVAFLDGLPLCHDDGRYLFVHAGIDPARPLDAQSERDMLWIRTPFLACGDDLGRVVVHGHTIESDMPRVRRNRLGIDTGAYHTGRLTVAALEGDDVRFALVTAKGTTLVRPRAVDFHPARTAEAAAP